MSEPLEHSIKLNILIMTYSAHILVCSVSNLCNWQRLSLMYNSAKINIFIILILPLLSLKMSTFKNIIIS